MHSILLVSFCCAALTAFLSSCSVAPPIQREVPQLEEGAAVTRYSIIFVIHGDGEYLYHDTTGNEYNADEEALEEAQSVAQQNPCAEVFIFHRKYKRHFLLFFPLRDGEFYYYRNGKLVANELYWRDQEYSSFEPEIEFFKRFRVGGQHEMVRMFLYFGHEIPEYGGAGYDESYPARTFNVQDVASELNDFTPDSTKFDLMILSTCFGGTPHTIGTLGSYSRTIIASPENLHLSYFDFHLLERLDIGLQDGDVPAFAIRFAQQAFDQLAENVQTAVSVAVYDVDRVQKFLRSAQIVYDSALTKIKREPRTSMSTIDHCDCADLPGFALPTITEGVAVLYRPARFGRLKQKKNHSGWECWKVLEHYMQTQ